MMCEKCAYCYKADGDKYHTCHYAEEVGREPNRRYVPPCGEYHDDVDFVVSERKDYEEERKPLLDLLTYLRERQETDENWDSAPLVFGYDGRTAETYNAYSYEPFEEAIEKCLDGLDTMYGDKFNWGKDV